MLMGRLIDKGKVVDKISDLFFDKYEEKANSDLTEFYKEVLKILINEKGQSEWISVKDKLPESDGFYLAWYTFNDGRHACDIFYYNCCGSSMSSAITHWMTLPEPPKEGGAE
jgi:hypothetical protein